MDFAVIAHDDPHDYDDNECPTDPDIAGLGVGFTTVPTRNGSFTAD
jgi:hypothetical protein